MCRPFTAFLVYCKPLITRLRLYCLLHDFTHSFSYIISYLSLLLLGVPQGSSNRSLLFKIVINNLSARINCSKFLLFDDNLEIYSDVKSVEGCKALQANADAVQQCCGETCVELGIRKTKFYLPCLRPAVIHFVITSMVLILLSDYKWSWCYVR
jgi:hypothetical protein